MLLRWWDLQKHITHHHTSSHQSCEVSASVHSGGSSMLSRKNQIMEKKCRDALACLQFSDTGWYKNGTAWCWYSFSVFAWLAGTGKRCERAPVDSIDLIRDSLAKNGSKLCWNAPIISCCRAQSKSNVSFCLLYHENMRRHILFYQPFSEQVVKSVPWVNSFKSLSQSLSICSDWSGWSWKYLTADDRHQTFRTLRMTSKWLCT